MRNKLKLKIIHEKNKLNSIKWLVFTTIKIYYCTFYMITPDHVYI
jgi:hypothetical protein